jgi:hypothetical protein
MSTWLQRFRDTRSARLSEALARLPVHRTHPAIVYSDGPTRAGAARLMMPGVADRSTRFREGNGAKPWTSYVSVT